MKCKVCNALEYAFVIIFGIGIIGLPIKIILAFIEGQTKPAMLFTDGICWGIFMAAAFPIVKKKWRKLR